MASIVILGAGLTGISTAYHLEQRGFFDYHIFEKEASIGGLCRSVEQDGFTFDFTGHLLHTSDAYFRSLIEQIVGLNNFNTVSRKSYIYSHGGYTKYPYQINLHGLPVHVIAECIEGYVLRNKNARNPKTFREWVLKNFGAGFGKHFFFPYQPKIFSQSVDKLTASWTGRFVPSTSLIDIVKGALEPLQDDIGYNANFLYPKRGGIVSWVNKLAQQITNPIYTNNCVQSVDMKEKVVTFTNGHAQHYDILISTLPLDRFITITQEKAASNYKKALPHLLCNSVMNFNLGFNRDDISDKHWIYFPEKEFPFYRVGFPHNFSSEVVPAGCSSLYGEYAYIKKSPRWIHETTKNAISGIKKVLGISAQDIITEKIISISHAYVTYDQWRDKNLATLLNELQKEQVYSIGRYGAWKYSSMQEAVLDGKQTAEMVTIIPAKRMHLSSLSNAVQQEHSHEVTP